MSLRRWLRRRKNRARPNYLDTALAAQQLLDPGRIGVLAVYHQADCAHWSGKPCNCQCDTELAIHEDAHSAHRAIRERAGEGNSE